MKTTIYILFILFSALSHPTKPVIKPHEIDIFITKPIPAVLKPISAPVLQQPVTLAPIPVATPQSIESAPATQITNYSGSLNDWLSALRSCESSGNYAEDTGNGFYGAYQFTISTWNALGTGYARADLAPASVQDAAIIANTKAATGGLATQNPGCYVKEGLSAFPPS